MDTILLGVDELGKISSDNGSTPVLVRCGGGCFVCPASDAGYFINIITEHGNDYIRDVSIFNTTDNGQR